MEIILNGQPQNIAHERTIAELLCDLGYVQKFVAVAVNGTCVRRADFDTRRVSPGDDIEVLAPMAGG
jgi:sulfur carrier protein